MGGVSYAWWRAPFVLERDRGALEFWPASSVTEVGMRKSGPSSSSSRRYYKEVVPLLGEVNWYSL